MEPRGSNWMLTSNKQEEPSREAADRDIALHIVNSKFHLDQESVQKRDQVDAKSNKQWELKVSPIDGNTENHLRPPHHWNHFHNVQLHLDSRVSVKNFHPLFSSHIWLVSWLGRGWARAGKTGSRTAMVKAIAEISFPRGNFSRTDWTVWVNNFATYL